MDYCADFRYDLDFGQKGEQFVSSILGMIMEGTGKVEVKQDRITTKTGNMYVEYKSRGKASGIMTTHADYWVYVIGTSFICVKVPVMIELIKRGIKERKWRQGVPGGDDNTSMGVLVPVADIFHASLLSMHEDDAAK